jgi:hypothetical protein
MKLLRAHPKPNCYRAPYPIASVHARRPSQKATLSTSVLFYFCSYRLFLALASPEAFKIRSRYSTSTAAKHRPRTADRTKFGPVALMSDQGLMVGLKPKVPVVHDRRSIRMQRGVSRRSD